MEPRGKILAPTHPNQGVEYWHPEKKVGVWFLHNWRLDYKANVRLDVEPIICHYAYEDLVDAHTHFWSERENNAKDGKWSELKTMTVYEYLRIMTERGIDGINPFERINFMEFLSKWYLAHSEWVVEHLEEFFL